jgi:hypothetical protein
VSSQWLAATPLERGTGRGAAACVLGRILELVTSMSKHTAFAHVPPPDPDAVVDPNWLRLRSASLLPTLYMPPMMAGQQPTWMRAMATVLIGVFLLATALGLCLTYGPPNAGW